MTKATTLKLSLLGAFLSLGAIAGNEAQSSKRMKDNAEFVEKAAMVSKTQVNLSELAVSQSTNPAVKEFAQKVISDHKKAFSSLKSISSSGGYSLPFASIGSSSAEERDDLSDAESRSSDEGKSAGEQIGSAASRTADDIAEESKEAADDVRDSARKAGDDLKGSPTISQSKEYTKASEKAQEKYDDLAKLSGEKFDKEYLSAINSANNKAIKLVEKQSKSDWDSGLKSWAEDTLPTLREHEQLAKSVKQNLKGDRPSM
jgi:predicted outer membrane protein